MLLYYEVEVVFLLFSYRENVYVEHLELEVPSCIRGSGDNAALVERKPIPGMTLQVAVAFGM